MINAKIIQCTDNKPCTSLNNQCILNEECMIKCFGTNSCQNIDFYCPINNNFTLQCDSNSCKHLYLNGGKNNINILCNHYGSCSNITINATNTQNLNLFCQNTSISGCTDIVIYAEYVGNLNILCDGTYTCSDSIIYANNTDKINVYYIYLNYQHLLYHSIVQVLGVNR